MKEDIKDFDESDKRSTIFSGNLRFREIFISKHFDGISDFPMKFFIWWVFVNHPFSAGRKGW